MALRYDYGTAAQHGFGMTIDLLPTETRAVGRADADEVASILGTALWALTLLRTGKDGRAGRDNEPPQARPVTVENWHQVISTLETARTTLLSGITAAAIRTHRMAGGSIADLARAMDAPRSTAQARQTKVVNSAVSEWEAWATGLPDENPPATETWSYTVGVGLERSGSVVSDAGLLADWIDTVLWGLTLLRTGYSHRHGLRPAALGSWQGLINDLVHRLEPRIKGIIDAAVRTHASMPGGTVADLALAMGVPAKTAKSRRDKILGEFPGGWERWAIGTLLEPTDDDSANPALNVPLPEHRTEVGEVAARDGRLGTTCNCGWTSPERTTDNAEAERWGEAHRQEQTVKDTTIKRHPRRPAAQQVTEPAVEPAHKTDVYDWQDGLVICRCTCGEWEGTPTSNIVGAALEGKQHRENAGS
ncbi:hypothetical protein ABT093_30565 [Kitasatospora sp. NPDC002551]|uniref:hypothetical protein n=1 Tax=Kitasatospora sp. NPDC002551 TaxID=3154539 RepID=UPI00332B4B4B